MDEKHGHKRRPSEAQVQANRRNAEHSTGPKTRRGKAKSSRNALRHGAYAHTRLAIDAGPFAEDPKEVKAFLDEIVDSLAPRDRLEENRALRIAQLNLQERRLDRWESSLLAPDPANALEGGELVSAHEDFIIDQLREWNGSRFEAEGEEGEADRRSTSENPERPWELMAVWLRALTGNQLIIRGLWDPTKEPSSPDEWKRALEIIAKKYYPEPLNLSYALLSAVSALSRSDEIEAYRYRAREAQRGVAVTDTCNAQRSRITSELMKQVAMYAMLRTRLIAEQG